MTHLEYDEAQRCELPSLIYILDEERQPVLPRYVETGEGATKLRVLKDHLRKSHIVSFYTTEHDLASKILADIPPVLQKIGTRIDDRLTVISRARSNHFVFPFDLIDLKLAEPDNLTDLKEEADPGASKGNRSRTFVKKDSHATLATSDESDFSVLVVEDHPDQRDLLSIVLQREGYRVVTASNGNEALIKLKETDSIGMVLSDIMMPEMDGFQLIKRIRHNPKLNLVHIIIVTQRVLESDRVRALDLGADDYITKPFSFSELLARLRVGRRNVSRQMDLLKQLAETDPLTGLLKRNAFESLAQKEFRRAAASNSPFWLLIISVDEFSGINKLHGTKTGDEALMEIAKLISNTLVPGSLIGRFGGDEFCVGLSERSLGDVTGLAEQLHRNIETTIFRSLSSTFSLTVSIGIGSTALKNYSRLEEIFSDAQKAVDSAKQSGKNNCKICFPEVLTRQPRR